MIIIPWWFVIFAIIMGSIYYKEAMNRKTNDNPKKCYMILAVWVFVTCFVLVFVNGLTPQPLPPDLMVDPSPEVIFQTMVWFLAVPSVVLLYLMVIDISIYHRGI